MVLESNSLVQTALIPMVTVSANGLLLLGIQNRYGRIIDRIRQFDAEMRDMRSRTKKKTDKTRAESIRKQTPLLLERGRLVRNSLFCLLLSMLLAVLTSALIFVENVTGFGTTYLTFGLFSASMLSMVAALFFASKEMAVSYTTLVEIEAESGYL